MEIAQAIASKRERLVTALRDLRQKLDVGSARFWGPLAWSYSSPEAREVHEAIVAASTALCGDSQDWTGDPEIADPFTRSGIRELFVRMYDHLDQLPAPGYVRWLDKVIAELGAEPVLPSPPEFDFSLDNRRLRRTKPK